MTKQITLLFCILFLTGIAIQAQFCFKPKTSFSIGIDPTSFCTADFNRDGKPDIATTNNSSGSGSVSVLLGNGSGGFGAVSNFTVDALPRSICTADFNGDGIPDLATINTGPGTVTVLIGNGSGGFSALSSFMVGIYNTTAVITTADFDGDSNVDLAITSGYSFVVVLLGKGTGSFGFPSHINADNNTHAIVCADFNGDGKADIATTTRNTTSSVSILLGDGTGFFSLATNFSIADLPSSMIQGDFNGDGKTDLATANAVNNTTGNISVLLGTGTGTFGTANNIGIGISTVPRSLCWADFDRDGKKDLALACIANNNSGNITVLTGNGTGSFSSPMVFAVDSFPNSVAAADLNADGKMDILGLSSKTNIDNGKVSVLINCNTSGINTMEKEYVSILYPNTSKGIFYIKNAPGITGILITNALGETIYTSSLDMVADAKRIDLESLASGIYFYKFLEENKVKQTGKLIIE
jgi:hypothetical protein